MDIGNDHEVSLIGPAVHGREEVFEVIARFGEEDFSFAILDILLVV
jgi:hypothetical protein